MNSERIMRSLLVVYAHIQGEVVNRDGTRIKLPLDPQKCISTHVMQVESPIILAVNDPERVLLTDIDFFLKGNSYF